MNSLELELVIIEIINIHKKISPQQLLKEIINDNPDVQNIDIKKVLEEYLGFKIPDEECGSVYIEKNFLTVYIFKRFYKIRINTDKKPKPKLNIILIFTASSHSK